MPIAGHELKAGQSWAYRTPEGYESSRLVIGAIATFSGDSRIVCLTVTDAPQRQPDGALTTVTIPFLPMSEAAFAATVTDLDVAGEATLDAGFADALGDWSGDPRGLTCFTVAFDGFLDRLIAHQMAAIVGSDAA